MGISNEAFEACKKALKMDSNADFLWDTLGLLYCSIGQFNAAKRAYSIAFTLDPSCISYKNTITKIENLQHQPLTEAPLLNELAQQEKKLKLPDVLSEELIHICEFCGENFDARKQKCPQCGQIRG